MKNGKTGYTNFNYRASDASSKLTPPTSTENGATTKFTHINELLKIQKRKGKPAKTILPLSGGSFLLGRFGLISCKTFEIMNATYSLMGKK
jgi:hypothetical protein